MLRDRAASDEAKLHRAGGGSVEGFGPRPFGIVDSDGPETIRMRKYATCTHVLLAEIGVETGATPRQVVWSNNKARLYRYRRPEAGDGKRRAIPMLLVYGFVLKPYILDLVPGNSLVESLVQEGFDVYLLDFGISGPEDSALSLEDLVLDYLPGAVQAVLETSGAAEITVFGQSQGGTLSAMYAALFPDGPLKNLVLLSAPTDFAPRNPGPFGLWTHATRNSRAFFDPAIVPRFIGNLPTDLASQFINSAAALQATGVTLAAWPFGHPFGGYDAALRKARGLADRDVSMRSWLAVSRWVDDAAPFPGETFRTWVGELYQRNALVKGRMALRGTRVDLSNIRCAVLNVSGTWDYVVPPCQDQGHHGSRQRPGSGIRLPERRTRRHARRTGGRRKRLAAPPRVARATLGPRRMTAIVDTLQPADPPAEDNPIAPTSRWMAAARARESERADRLFYDPLAAALAGPQGFAWLRHMKAAAWSDGPGLYPVIRTRFFDEYLLGACRRLGVRQVVLAAAGLDTRAFRLDWPPRTRVYELDLPEVLLVKEGVIEDSGAKATCERQTVAVDLREATWSEALLAAGYEPPRQSIWLIEGLLFYLADDAVDELLAKVGSLTATGSLVGLDVMNSDLFLAPVAWPLQAALARRGAPGRFGTNDPETLMIRHGFDADVTQPGQEGANFGRWPKPMLTREVPGLPRSFLVRARRS